MIFAVQRRRWREGLLRHDAQWPAQADALRGRLHSRHGPHCQGFEALAPHPALVRRHPSHVHEGELPQLLSHRAIGKRLQPTASFTLARIQLDQSRHHLPERAQILFGAQPVRDKT